MLLGQSIFQSVLNRLEDEKQETEEAGPDNADFRIRGLGAGFVTPEGRPAAAETDTDAYLDYLADWLEQPSEAAPATDREEAPPQKPVMPPHLERLTEAEIAEDLAISPKDSEAVLNDRRRQFAKLNHPDSVSAEFRDNATTRMKIANLLIDRALAAFG
ncbi:hypothetical protein [Neorhizobium sp. JUb45]|uniref:hypothetical protein n=1 Tax=unclassified Neorhizobium TaxID=2629175 RepID=UPI00104670A5|nr:hypothetical protein [Neorhizobium sp. JUb45]TCR06675.1 hypothetical protein EDF70_101636 [Neorhizobium sp. JUb45]